MSTSPDAFAALPLTVLSDSRVTAAQEQARALGFSAGYAAGAKAAAQELEAQLAQVAQDASARSAQSQEELQLAVAAFADAVTATQNRELPVLDAAREMLCTLALDLARSVVDGITTQPSPIEGVSSGALQALLRATRGASSVSPIRVAMAPNQADQVLEHWDLVLRFLDNAEVSVVPDAKLSPGSAIATYPHGHIDATLESAFERARDALDAGLTQARQGSDLTQQSEQAQDMGSSLQATPTGLAC